MAAIKNISPKLKGSTLFEVIVAMLILMVSFGIAMVTIVNLFRSAEFNTRFRARLTINNLATQTINSGEYIDKDTTVEGLVVSQKILPSTFDTKLKVLQLTAKAKDGRVIDGTKQLVIAP